MCSVLRFGGNKSYDFTKIALKIIKMSKSNMTYKIIRKTDDGCQKPKHRLLEEKGSTAKSNFIKYVSTKQTKKLLQKKL